MNDSAPNTLTNEERELHDLLDRVLSSTTTRPILDDIGARLASLQDEIADAVERSKLSVAGQLRGTEGGLRNALEDGLERIQRRIDDELGPALRELQESTVRGLASLDAQGEGTHTRLQSMAETQQTLATMNAERYAAMLDEFKQHVQSSQEAQTRADAAIESRIAELEARLSEGQFQTDRLLRWMLGLQGFTAAASVTAILLAIFGAKA